MCAIAYYTYDDYKQWEGDWELIYGQAVAMAPAPVISHQMVAFNIAKEISNNLECDECIVVLEEDWIICDNTVKKDEKIKFEIYEKEKVDYYILAYPNHCKAKVYRLKEGKFDKVGDFIKETFYIEDISCPTKIDFDEVFKRLRK